MHRFLNGLLTLATQDSPATPKATDPASGTSAAASPLIDAASGLGDKAAEVAEAASKTAEAVDAASGGSGWGGLLILVLVIAVVILPFVFGQLIANALKVREWGFRCGISLFALTLGLAPFVSALISGRELADTIRLGIDLKGGTNMVFQVRGEGKEVTNAVMDKMVGAVGKRINPSGTEEITVRQVGADRIEVIVPGEDPQTVDEIKRRITELGSLEFFIAANAQEDREVVQQAMAMSRDEKDLRDSANGEIAIWREAFEKEGQPKLLTGTGLVSRPVEKIRTENGKSVKYNTEEYLLLVDPPEDRVTGDYLISASRGFGNNGETIVNFSFNQRGGFLFQQLTSQNLPQPGREPRKLAILLNRQVYSAPQINSVISDRGMIEGGAGGFTQEEAQELSDVLNAGALEVPIDPKPLSEATVDPTLGADVRRKGVTSVLVGGAAVVLFMGVYYQVAGLVAIISLMLNTILVMGTMALIDATFTLPGLAGIVLGIGMAVDANVLIYERMREELGRGASLRMAIQNGFAKAFTTIVDSNVTTLLTAAILFMIGTDQVKGFAVTLFIGITMSMFTACYVGHLLFDIMERKRWLTTLRMMSIVGRTNWDFVGRIRLCLTLSLVSIGVGMLAFLVRGQDNFDIDFTGGTMVTLQLKEPGKTEDVQRVLATQFPGGFSLERLSMSDETTEGVGRHFRLRTRERDSEATNDDRQSAEERVRDKVYEAFRSEPGMQLRMVSMEFGEISPIQVAVGDESAEAITLRRFQGGSVVSLKLSDEVATGTIADQLSGSLAKLKDGTQVKYGTPQNLFEIVGTEGSGVNVGERDVRKYSKLEVRALPAIPADDLRTALQDMQATMSASPLFDEVNTFSSSVAGEMLQSAFLAIVFSMLVVVGYIWFRFQNVDFGIAGVAALIHDVLFVMGMLALVSWLRGTFVGDLLLISDMPINLPMIAAFLTLVGYSLNDTIVMFDRIREIRGKNPAITATMVNEATNQTLARTLLTSFTVGIVVAILYVLGGEGIHGFAFCMLIGVVVGTYSSIYIANPILIWLMARRQAVTR